MDGMHDLGGKQGFGPVAVTQSDPAFQTEWEARLFAITQTAPMGDWTIDWFRNLVELLEPRTYLNEPYFQKWMMALLTGLVQNGVITRSEALGQGAQSVSPPPEALSLAEVLQKDRENEFDYSRSIEAPPAFGIGAPVRTRAHMQAAHTRLPAYARGRNGIIIAHHGAHVFPDKAARGVEAAQHLYTVEFAAPELWGEDGVPGDTVTLDLWESYLVQP